LPLINASAAYAAGATGDGILVAVVDTGINADHPEFTGQIAAQLDVADATRGGGDTDGHGTGVAGVIAANKDDRLMHGVAFNAQIISIRADTVDSCESDGGEGCTFSDSNTARAIDAAINNGAQIVNLSLGRDPGVGDGTSLTFAAMQRAVNAGLLIVVAAGNQDEEEDAPDPSPGFPGTFASDPRAGGLVVTVGSVDLDGTISDFSNRAEGFEDFYLVAPGRRILAPFIDDDDGDAQYALFSGTSFAAPHVAGALALLLDGFPTLTGAEALQILFDTAVDLGAPGRDATYGAGLIDLEAAFQPVGTSSVQVAGAQTETVIPVMFAAPSGASGDWIWQSGVFEGALLRDQYDRGFTFDPARPDAAGTSPGLLAMEAAAERGLARQVRTLAGPAEVNLRINPDRPHALTNMPEEVYRDAPDMSFAFRSGGLTIEAGRGFAAPAPMPAAGVSVLSQTLFGGAVAGLSAQREWAAVRFDHGALSFQMRASGSGEDAFQAAGASWSQWGQTLGFELGAGREEDRALGGLMAARFGEDDASQSRFMAALWSGDLPLGWRGAARFEQARVDFDLPQYLRLEDTVQASAWSVGVDRAAPGGRFGLTLSQPLRVEQGALSASVPVGIDEFNRSIFERRVASLAPSGREMSLEAAWHVSVNERTSASFAARFTDAPGHIRKADDEGLVWAGLRTTW
jgi:hypothetical protein